MSRRVVVTGVGILSSLGTDYQEVTTSLRAGKSGVSSVETWAEYGLPVNIAGLVKNVDEKKQKSNIPRKKLAYASEAALYCVLAASDAANDAGLTEEDFAQERTACIVGSGVSGSRATYAGGKKLYANRANRISPYTVVHSMGSTCSASVANVLNIKGRSYSISSACATSSHNIGHSYELIRDNAVDLAVTGGGEDPNEMVAAAFSAMRLALSTSHNDRPESASRPYDVDRDGFVVSGGGGVLVLEELEHARNRGATIYAELLGCAANSDANDIVSPGPAGIQAGKCIESALAASGVSTDQVDYVNTHGTATVDGDIAETNALRRVFGNKLRAMSSTKSMSGHAMAASGAHEIIYCISMLQNNFIAPSINIENVDPQFADLPIVVQSQEADLNVIVKNSFGFGGTNAVTVLGRYSE